jgi:lysyl-tRNA synthetase class II
MLKKGVKMKKFGLTLIGIGLFLFLLSAQAQPQKILEDYRPVIDLSMDVLAMLELEKTTELVVSAEQAQALSPLLNDLQTKDSLTNDEANSYIQQLNEQILNAEQRDWVTARSDELFTELFNSTRPPPVGMGLGMRLMMGEPVNLVKEGPSKDALNEFVEIVGAKAN